MVILAFARFTPNDNV